MDIFSIIHSILLEGGHRREAARLLIKTNKWGKRKIIVLSVFDIFQFLEDPLQSEDFYDHVSR